MPLLIPLMKKVAAACPWYLIFRRCGCSLIMIFHASEFAQDSFSAEDIARNIATGDRFRWMMEQIMFEVHDATEHFKQERSCSSRQSFATAYSNRSSGSTDIAWDRILMQKDITSSTTRKNLAAVLRDMNNSADERYQAIKELERASMDIVLNEHWETILESLCIALGDPDQRIVTKSLDLHLRLFKISPPEAIGSIYQSISFHLIELCNSMSLGKDLHLTEQKVSVQD